MASADSPPGYDYQDTPRTVVAIEILPEGVTDYSPRSSPSNTPTSSPLSSTFPASTFHHSQPRPITVIDPTVTFTSRSSMVAHSYFTVQRDGQAVHRETAAVDLHSHSVDAGPSSDIGCIFYYTAPLVPTYWSNICQDQGKLFLPHGMGVFARFLHPKCHFIRLITTLLQILLGFQSSTTFISTLDRPQSRRMLLNKAT